MTEIIQETIIMFIGFVMLVVVIFLNIDRAMRKSNRGKRRYDRTSVRPSAEFEQWKKTLKTNCSEAEFLRFMSFLQSYRGGFRRRDGRFEYLGREKGDLKGIFFNIVAPNPNLNTIQKEKFRNFAISVGVNGLDVRPDYETRDSKLRNNEIDSDSFQRKEVGNKGEKLVRDILKELENTGAAVINGAKLKANGVVREFDHILVCKNGVFVLETKAFGMTDGHAAKAALFIDPGDQWILRRNKKNHELISPTEQINAEYRHLSRCISTMKSFTIHPIVVLSNTELFIKQNIPLDYQVVRADNLISVVNEYNDFLSSSDIRLIIGIIDECRVN